jgi:drug/metabolite transporter (DMT)-like permease
VPLAAHVSLAAAQVGFGLFPVAGKLVFEGGISPLALAALRAAFGAGSLFLVAQLSGARPVERRSDLLRLALYAFFGIVLNQVFYLEGLSRSSATHAGVLVAATPAVAYGLAILLRRESPSPGPTLGVVCAIVGAAWIALLRPAGPPGRSAPSLEGDLFLCANVTCYAIYLVLVRDILGRVEPLRAIAWVFLFGALANVPLGIADLHEVPWANVPPRAWAALGFVLLFPTSVCYALNVYALRKAPSSVAAVYTTSQPIVACASAGLFLGERTPVVETVAASVLILGGVVLVGFRRPS